MKSHYINNLEAGQSVNDTFILTKKIVKEKKDGGAYTILEFADRSGSIEGIAWESASDDLKTISVGDCVLVSGNVSEYHDKLEIVVSEIRRVPEQEIDPADFLPRSEEDIEQVMTTIQAFQARVENTYLKQLLNLFFSDQTFIDKFQSAPAAKRAHHAYLGGLAVHTLNILRLIDGIQPAYPFLDYDLLITAALLHDIGKIHEYSYKNRIDLSTRGKMLGHIIISYEMVAEKINMMPQFPDDLRLKLLHMIVSHHGEFEWGSPKLPVFPEALVLHFFDNLDSKIEMMMNELKKNRGSEREWSDYHPYLEREIYLREKL
jgi:3'-5' exoribonuclease